VLLTFSFKNLFWPTGDGSSICVSQSLRLFQVKNHTTSRKTAETVNVQRQVRDRQNQA